MKIIALLLALLAVVVSSVVSLKNDVCGLPDSVVGNCRAALPKWSYDSDSNACVQFYYGGCGGNGNRFKTIDECEEVCKEE